MSIPHRNPTVSVKISGMPSDGDSGSAGSPQHPIVISINVTVAI
jgi:hypothetical protein